MGQDTSSIESELEDVETQLTQYGVEFLTTQEVLERFGDDDGIMPYVSVPENGKTK